MICGFVDSLNQQVRFEEIAQGKGLFLTADGSEIPRPLVNALAKQYRDTGAHYKFDAKLPGISATELISPIQQTMLVRRHNIFVRPDDAFFAMLGTLMHKVIEIGSEGLEGYDSERKIVAMFDGVQVGGTIDLIRHLDSGVVEGGDYKLTSAYKIKKMKQYGVEATSPEYHWQGNIYAWLYMMETGNVPIAWNLHTLCRDHGSRTQVEKIETIPIRLEDAGTVENYISTRIVQLKAAEERPDSLLPRCTTEETWQGRRCAKYCAAAPACGQFLGLHDVA